MCSSDLLLGQSPGHGDALMKRLEERSGGLCPAGPGTVYPVLQQLEDQGRVRSRESDGKKVYEITDAGRAELASRADAVDRIWQRAGRWREWGFRLGSDTVEVASAVGRVTKAAFVAAGDDRRAERVIEILDRVRTEIEEVR